MSQQFFGSRFRRTKGLAAACLVAMTCVRGVGTTSQETDGGPNQVLEWNQVFIDTLIATVDGEFVESAARRHRAHGDIRRVQRHRTALHARSSFSNTAPAARRGGPLSLLPPTRRSSGLFPARQAALDARVCGLTRRAERRWRGRWSIARAGHCLGHGSRAAGARVARDGRVHRAVSRHSRAAPAVGQWRPTPPAVRSHERAGPGVHRHPFVLTNSAQFQPPPPRGARRARPTRTISTPSRRSAAAPARRAPTTSRRWRVFWEGNASVHWNQAANQIARANHLSMSDSNRLLAVLNIAMADTAITTWSGQALLRRRSPTEVTWRPVTAIPLADTDGNPDTVADPAWLPLINTPVASRVSGRASESQRRGRDGAARTLRRSSSSSR